MRDYAEPMTLGELKSRVDWAHELLEKSEYHSQVWHSMVGDAMQGLVNAWAGQQPMPKRLCDEESEQEGNCGGINSQDSFQRYETLRREYSTAEMFLDAFYFERHLPILYPVVVEMLVRFTRMQNQRLEAMGKLIDDRMKGPVPLFISPFEALKAELESWKR
jgi:hypothetical protein